VPSRTVKVMEAPDHEHLSNILVDEFKHIPKGMSVIKVSFSQVRVCHMDQRCSETPQCVVIELYIRSSSFCCRSQLPATYSVATNGAMTSIQDPRIMVHNLPPAKTVDLGNMPINVIRCMGMVTLLHSSHFQVLLSFITILHST
jgi:hypothetical protein